MEVDYLVVGAGAMGMAFVDVVLAEDASARIAIVDQRAHPGGHWNDAYSFVALHQPAAFYGVTSRQQSWKIKVRRKVVDATYMNVQVPSVTRPRYPVSPQARLVPPNALPKQREPWDRYMIIGAGKTGMDAALFLLDQGVEAERIHWITPHDAWLFDRARVQPGLLLSDFLRQLGQIAESSHVDEVFLGLENSGTMCRLDRDRLPRKWRCATVSQSELAQLRKIRNVVRLGRVERIEASEIIMKEGVIPTDGRTLHVDCTADGLAKREPSTIFEPDRITLQSVFMCQQVFSAAMLGRLETLNLSDAERNGAVQVVPHPELKEDYVTALLASIENLIRLQPRMGWWLRRCRLNFAHHERLLHFLLASARIRRSLPPARASADRMLPPAPSRAFE